MSTFEHFQSYRDNLRRTCIPGCGEYADKNPTKNPAFPTISSYLIFLVEKIKRSIKDGCMVSYYDTISKHQFAMLQLFSKMINERLWGEDDCTQKEYKYLILKEGWMWFKYSKSTGIPLNNITDRTLVLPRYTDFNKHVWENTACIDADEAQFLGTIEDQELRKDILRRKKIGHKLVPKSSSSADQIPIDCINNDLIVMDWTLTIRPQDEERE